MMGENSAYVEADPLCEQCKKWYRLQRKARREAVWVQLFKDLFKNIFPEIPYSQLLVSESDMFEHFQLFFNTSVACQYLPHYPASAPRETSSRRTPQ
jgi:hypothetical protein